MLGMFKYNVYLYIYNFTFTSLYTFNKLRRNKLEKQLYREFGAAPL